MGSLIWVVFYTLFFGLIIGIPLCVIILCLFDDDRKRWIEEGPIISAETLIFIEEQLWPRMEGNLIIDTCSFMNCKTTEGRYVFKALKQSCIENNFKIQILQDVFEELTKHRKGEDQSKQKDAQAAKKLILDFQEHHIVNINGGLGFPDSSKKYYADKAIADFILQCLEQGTSVYLITEDVDLVIRIRDLLERKHFSIPEKMITDLTSLHENAARRSGLFTYLESYSKLFVGSNCKAQLLDEAKRVFDEVSFPEIMLD